MRKLDTSELNRQTIEEFKKTSKSPILVVLDNIRSMNNIGSIFRICDALLIKKIYLCGITAHPPNKDIRKTALGAENAVDWEYHTRTIDVIQSLKNEKYTIIAVEQTTQSISLNNFEVKKGNKYALIFGNEVQGVQQEVINLSDVSIEIPQYGTKHSLNISVCGGIVLWDIFNKVMNRNGRSKD